MQIVKQYKLQHRLLQTVLMRENAVILGVGCTPGGGAYISVLENPEYEMIEYHVLTMNYKSQIESGVKGEFVGSYSSHLNDQNHFVFIGYRGGPVVWEEGEKE